LPEPLLRLDGVKTDIGQYHILHGVDLDVPQGAVTMLLGRNGAGKTTTLRSVMGLWKPHAGRVMLAGQNIAGQDPATIARAGVALVPEDMGIFANLTVEENMILAATGGRPDPARLDWLFSVFPPLKTFWKNPAGTLSGGQKQMLATARAMAEERRLYLIDEPSKGLAPAIVSTLARALRQLKDQGATILMVEQNFKLARALGDHAAVMDDGRIVWAGPMATLAADTALQERLMGLSMEGHA
jgi:branched-chain amino acid transport system ATP-binding protein